ncbi:MAG: adenosylcobinamide-GDP ribazoletransferase [Candidatus Jordarchaeales archaeon]
MGVWSSLKLLLSFFTVIPVKHAGSLSEAAGHLALIPIIGVIYGLLAGISLAGMGLLLPSLPSAALTLLAVNFLNGFFHMDGLVDFGDGLTALGGRDERLSAMKDTHIGAGGASIAIMTVVASIVLYGSIPQRYALLSAFTVEVMCMNSMIACACAGRPRGSGLGSLFVENASWKTLAASSLLSAALTTMFFTTSARLLGFAASCELAPLIPVSLAASIMTGLAIASLSNKVFGYVTGDVLGACHELSRIPILIAALVIQLA